MLKLLTSSQIREADAYTIANKPIQSLDLMENASRAFVELFMEDFSDRTLSISVYCGTGNNGGDGLAIARILHKEGYERIKVIIARFSEKSSLDFNINLDRLKSLDLEVKEIYRAADAGPENADIIIDALLGSGLNKPLDGEWKDLVLWLNTLDGAKVAVDIPSGFKAEGAVGRTDAVFRADLAITFQRARLNFLLPDSSPYLKYFEVADIGLDEAFMQDGEGPYYLLSEDDIRDRLRARLPFSHKGSYGHALLVAGAPETMGAALLCSKACLYTGAGLTSACIPAEGLNALNAAMPEVMAVVREGNRLPASLQWGKYQSAGIGPGLGTGDKSLHVLKDTLKNFAKPIVIDADGLNLISSNYELMQLVPEFSVLTPHVKEFDRLFGEHTSWWERLETGIDRAVTLGCTIVLKNRYTIIFTPEGRCLFNPTGTPAMATGGMGDVLTGMIVSFVAQGYTPEDAAIMGVYLHGIAGESVQGYVVPPSRLIEALPEVILRYL
ncbi:NAD(P)H-hydrate epimerase [Arcticibacter tournemirensis]|uniref:Bifunctional NAD(P)H-hydrate repair enzyme n=1 Tax=Arcticibacter tournemirensis TaxID=699437 RepID=A0A5M9HHF2_9SPHI|nr:NAD(P)H-hydrate dehydratase [Arcticibacter tournemirensis]KAA8485919.1 NAD(P)H-hydrate dehydratase [Arcticibacter tournemirensis]TQM46823.1 NAD(P)H-hydrate epimerase [Arcticibacter tournemirensis]